MVYILESNADSLSVELEYSTELFRRESIDTFNGYFKQIVSIVTDNPDIRLEDIRISGDWSDQKIPRRR